MAHKHALSAERPRAFKCSRAMFAKSCSRCLTKVSVRKGKSCSYGQRLNRSWPRIPLFTWNVKSGLFLVVTAQEMENEKAVKINYTNSDSELRPRAVSVKVEVAVLGFLPLIVRTISVDVKQH